MDNLSPELNAIVDLIGDPLETIDLRQIIIDEKITIVFGKGDKQSVLVFRVTKPAGPGWGEDAAEFVIENCCLQPSSKEESFRKDFAFPPIGLKAYIVGGATKNPEAPMGFTMLSVHRISRGRHLLWYMPKEDREVEIGWLFPETVTNILRA